MDRIHVKDARRHDFAILYNVVVQRYGPQIGPSAFYLYCTLLCMADKDGKCYPGLAYLIKATGMSRNTILASTRTLVSHGLIEVVESPQRKSNTYTIVHIETGGSKTEPPGGKLSNFDTSDYDAQEGGSVSDTSVVQNLTGGGSDSDKSVVHFLTGGGSNFDAEVVQNLNPNKTHTEQDSYEQDSLEQEVMNKRGRARDLDADCEQPAHFLESIQKIMGVDFTSKQAKSYGDQFMELHTVATESEILRCYMEAMEQARAKNKPYHFEWLERDLPGMLQRIRAKCTEGATPLERIMEAEAEDYDAVMGRRAGRARPTDHFG